MATVIDGETLCVCGHTSDEHGERWCLWSAPGYPVDDCVEFRPARAVEGADSDGEE